MGRPRLEPLDRAQKHELGGRGCEQVAAGEGLGRVDAALVLHQIALHPHRVDAVGRDQRALVSCCAQ